MHDARGTVQLDLSGIVRRGILGTDARSNTFGSKDAHKAAVLADHLNHGAVLELGDGGVVEHARPGAEFDIVAVGDGLIRLGLADIGGGGLREQRAGKACRKAQRDDDERGRQVGQYA